MPNEKELKAAISRVATPVSNKIPAADVFKLVEKLEAAERHELLIREMVAGGKPIPEFSTNYSRFLEFVKANRIPALRDRTSEAARRLEIIKGMHGGRRINHLHLGGQTYKLSDAQWESFAKEFAPNLAADIKKVNAIKFEALR